MSSSNILITALHWAESAQQRLRDAGLALHFMTGAVDEDALVQAFERQPFAGVVLRGSSPFTARVLAAASPHLRVIAKNGAGVDSVDLGAAAAQGVQVLAAVGANADAVAEHAIALMLSLVRQLNTLDLQVRAGHWPGSTYMGRDFRGSVVGILGFGSIGRRTAQLASALGARVLVYRRSGTSAPCEYDTESSWQAFLSRLDILSLHCPLNDTTRGVIDAQALAWLKPGALLINTARGPVVDEAALLDALRSGSLAGAGLDTFDAEPVAVDHPLLACPQVLLTPHVAGVTHQAATRVAMMTAENVLKGLHRV